MVEVSLTVGKLDASLALLLTKDHHLIEFPTILLPDGVQAGSIIKIKCDRDLELEKQQQEKFNQVQDSILELYGKKEPEPPLLKVKNITQTSCVLEWEKLQLANASIKSLSLYKNNVRLGQIPNALVNTTTKLSGLALDTVFKFRLRLDTTSGVYYSNELEIKTQKMTDLSGITICLGEINYEEEGYTEEDIKVLLSNIGGKPVQKEVQVDTTHFICTLAKGPQWKRAVDNNIPVVRPEWLKACMQEKRLAGVRIFYLDANLEMIKKYKIIANEPLINKRKSMLIKEQQEQYDEVSLDQTPKVAASTNTVNEPASIPKESKEPEKIEEVVSEKVDESEKVSTTEVNETSTTVEPAVEEPTAKPKVEHTVEPAAEPTIEQPTESENKTEKETTQDHEQIEEKAKANEVTEDSNSKEIKNDTDVTESQKENTAKKIMTENEKNTPVVENEESNTIKEKAQDETPINDAEHKENEEVPQVSQPSVIEEDASKSEPSSEDKTSEEPAHKSETVEEKTDELKKAGSDESKVENEKNSEGTAEDITE